MDLWICHFPTELTLPQLNMEIIQLLLYFFVILTQSRSLNISSIKNRISNLYSTADYVLEATKTIEILRPLPVWPPDSELNGRQSILIGYLTSGDTSTRLTQRLKTFFEPQIGYYNDGAITVGVEEINNSTEILPNHMVSETA